MDVSLDRPQRQLHDLSDFLVRFVLDVPEHDAGPVFGSELSNGSLDPSSRDSSSSRGDSLLETTAIEVAFALSEVTASGAPSILIVSTRRRLK